MAHLIFTADFHEMVRGKLKKGEKCYINYDPLRLTTGKDGFVHGHPNFDFKAHISFLPAGETVVDLTSDAGIITESIVRNDGLGSMLTGEFVIPADTYEITVWISLKDNTTGEQSYDSDFGKNFHFRLTQEDLKITAAQVVKDPAKGVAWLKLAASSTPEAEDVTFRYRVTNGENPLKEIPVSLFRTEKEGKAQWTAGDIQIPYDSVVIYDLIYCIGGKNFKIENNGNYFIADIKEGK